MIVNNFEPIKASELPGAGDPVGWALYAIAIQSLGQGGGAALLKGWQYTKFVSQNPGSQNNPDGNVRQNVQAVVAGDAIVTRYIRPDQITSERDAAAQRQRAAYAQLVALPGAQDKGVPYEVRALRIHALRLEVMWLHPLAEGNARVIPYGSYFPDLQIGQVYAFGALWKVARREAAKLTLEPAM